MNDAASRSEERLNLALSSAHMGTWDWDVPSGLVWWDERMHELFGLPAGTFSGRFDDFLTLIYESERERIREEFDTMLRKHAEFDSQFHVFWPAHTLHVIRMRAKVYCDSRGEVARVVGVAWDITERRRIEMALTRERNLLATLMRYLPDHIYFKDESSRFIAVSEAMARCVGKDHPGELIGKTDRDFFAPEHAERALENERHIMATGEPIIGLEEKITINGVSESWVSTTKMPLTDAAGKTIGTFGLSRNITERKRSEENLRRLAEELRKQNEALQEDLEMARELQSALLPQRYPHFPHHVPETESAVRFYHYFQPSMIVSGDFFDVFDISDDKAGLFICDVMGHGVRAALVAATVRTLTTELRAAWNDPGVFLAQLNHSLVNMLRNGNITLFASAFYVVADLARGELRYANAGHPCPLRLTHEDGMGGAKPAPLNGGNHGPALGLFPNAWYQTNSCRLSPRDVLLLFTDGLFEVEGAGGQLYDYHQLARAVGLRSEMPTHELCNSLIADVRQFSLNRQFSDDVCLVAMDIETRCGTNGALARSPGDSGRN